MSLDNIISKLDSSELLLAKVNEYNTIVIIIINNIIIVLLL